MSEKIKSIAIIDCAINSPALSCFNRMNLLSPIRLTYHHIPKMGLESLSLVASDAYVILGSSSNVEDRFPWHRDLSNFAEQELKKDKPVLGVCFGHQLMADRFGANVAPNSPKRDLNFEGTREIDIIQNKFGIKAGKRELFIAHGFQVNQLSDQLETIATSKECPHDGIQHKSLPFVGFQSHPEAFTTFARESIHAPLDQRQLNAALENGIQLMLEFFHYVDKR